MVTYYHSEVDVATNDTGGTPLLPITFPILAPNSNGLGVARVDFSCSVRGSVNSGPGIPEYWWVSSEALVDLWYDDTGSGTQPSIGSGDPRFLWVGQLNPRVSNAQTATAGQWRQSIIYDSTGQRTTTQTMRRGLGGTSTQAKVWFDVTCTDQYGVMGGTHTAAAANFAVNFSARVLWYSA